MALKTALVVMLNAALIQTGNITRYSGPLDKYVIIGCTIFQYFAYQNLLN